MVSQAMKPRSKSLVDHGRGLRRLGAAHDGPGVGLLRADGEIGDQAEQVVAGADHTVQAAVVQAEPFEEFRAIGFRQLRDFRLDRG